MVLNMTKYIGMLRINIHEAKTNLSRYLAAAAAGETVLICKRNVPVAEIRAIPATPTTARPIGLAHGSFEVSDAFFDPLPADFVNAFSGGA